MFKKPDPNWRTLFSTSWEIDEYSSASDWIRVYAYGLRDLKGFPSRVHARHALVEIESKLWRTHPASCALGVLITVMYSGLMFKWALPLMKQYWSGSVPTAMACIAWMVGGWLLFCLAIRGAVAVEVRRKLVDQGRMCSGCKVFLVKELEGRCPRCAARMGVD